MAIGAQSLVIGGIVVFVIAVNVVQIKLAHVFWYETTLLAVIFSQSHFVSLLISSSTTEPTLGY